MLVLSLTLDSCQNIDTAPSRPHVLFLSRSPLSSRAAREPGRAGRLFVIVCAMPMAFFDEAS